MRNTRKWLVLLLTIVMLVSNLGTTAMAAGNESPIKLAVSPTVGSDSTIQVQILATKAQTVADGKLVLTFDTGKLTYKGAEAGAAWGSDRVTLSVNRGSGKVILAFANARAAAEGVLFTLRFKATTDAVVAIDRSSYISDTNANLAQQIHICPSARFADVQNILPEIHEAVDYMVGNGYMNGMSGTTFGPNLDLNRAMMVTILYRIAGNPPVTGSHSFVDVPSGEFYTTPVIWAVKNQITTGLDESHFAPDKSLTRQELVAFLYRFAGVMGYDRTATTDLSAYTDTDKIQPYAVDAFKWAVASGVVKGTSETTLHPENTTTRAQICIMVTRLLKAQD